MDPGRVDPPRLPGIDPLYDEKPASGAEDTVSFGYTGFLVPPVVHGVDSPNGREQVVLEGEVMGGSLDIAYVRYTARAAVGQMKHPAGRIGTHSLLHERSGASHCGTRPTSDVQHSIT